MSPDLIVLVCTIIGCLLCAACVGAVSSWSAQREKKKAKVARQTDIDGLAWEIENPRPGESVLDVIEVRMHARMRRESFSRQGLDAADLDETGFPGHRGSMGATAGSTTRRSIGGSWEDPTSGPTTARDPPSPAPRRPASRADWVRVGPLDGVKHPSPLVELPPAGSPRVASPSHDRSLDGTYISPVHKAVAHLAAPHPPRAPYGARQTRKGKVPMAKVAVPTALAAIARDRRLARLHRTSDPHPQVPHTTPTDAIDPFEWSAEQLGSNGDERPEVKRLAAQAEEFRSRCAALAAKRSAEALLRRYWHAWRRAGQE